MFRRFFIFIRKSDWVLLLMTLFLVAFGLMALYSIEASAPESDFAGLQKQLIFLAIGVVLLIFFTILDYRYLGTYGYILFAVGVLLLLSVLVFGTTVRGTRGWIILFGDQGFQPVELVKIIMIITISKLLTSWRSEITTLRHLGEILLFGGLLVGLVLLQPDFGSGIILGSIFLGMIFLARIKRSYVVGILLLLVIVSIASWFFVLQSYQKERIRTFLDPSRDPYKSGYNIKQSIIAVGSGNIFGRGLGLGPQSQLNFLPAQETDFVFAVISEELGLVGASLLMLFFVLAIYRLIRIARMARDDFGRFLISGMVIYLLAQTMLNIGMNVGLLPVAGVPLPLVSYGGSSLIATCIMVGIAESIRIRHHTGITI